MFKKERKKGERNIQTKKKERKMFKQKERNITLLATIKLNKKRLVLPIG